MFINDYPFFFSLPLQYGSDEFGQDSPRYTSPKAATLYADPYYLGELLQTLLLFIKCLEIVSSLILEGIFFFVNFENKVITSFNIFNNVIYFGI